MKIQEKKDNISFDADPIMYKGVVFMVANPVRFVDVSQFLSRGLTNVSTTVFQKRNLLIGKNGSGKTRFLNALHDTLHVEQPNGMTVIKLDFSTFHLSGGQSLPEPASDLYSILISGDSANFFEFLGLVDQKNQDFIRDIMTAQFNIRAANPRKKAEAGLNGVNEHLKELIGYEIYFGAAPDHSPIIRKVDANGKTVREKPYAEMISEFSPGERFIFYLSFFLFYVDTVKHEKLILLLDEPELHLHPQVLYKTIHWLYHAKVVEELWIASHSLFLVPLFHFKEITLFENSSILSRNSKMYKQIYNDLVGFEDIGMFEMLKSMDNWEYYRFIAECFCLPTTVSEVNSKDEQFIKFAKKITEKASDAPLRVLDYGAGEFRIWECLQMAKESGELSVEKIAYEAYEPYPKSEAICQIEEHYGKNPFPFYKHIAKVPAQSYDAVVLMNVLHEVDILKWEQIFREIQNVLVPDGILIFLEVQTLSLGEQPYGNTGYLILGPHEVEKLFKHPISLVPKAATRDRNKSYCWAIPNHILAGVDSASICASLEELINNSKKTLNEQFLQKVRLAHGKKPLSTADTSARKYAFWSQQYINAVLASERLTGKHAPTKSFTLEQQKIDFPGFTQENIS